MEGVQLVCRLNLITAVCIENGGCSVGLSAAVWNVVRSEILELGISICQALGGLLTGFSCSFIAPTHAKV